MPTPLHGRIVSIIRERGPLTVAEFMELALYDAEHGYYARAAQRSGKQGDFFTSVDVSPLFGALIAAQLAEMWDLLRDAGADRFDLVEAGAGNGRLARDILDAAAAHHPDFYGRVRLTVVERSRAARDAQLATLTPHLDLLVSSRDDLPLDICGGIVANELLDALPVHVIEMTESGPREIVVAERAGTLIEAAAPVSNPAVLADLPALDPGERLEVGVAATRWIQGAAASLTQGFLLLFDYGYERSPGHFRTHPRGTLMAYQAHRADSAGLLTRPGETDLTAHVDLTAIRHAAEEAGLRTLGIVDQTYFLIALGLVDRLRAGDDRAAIKERLAARTLAMPGGLGDTMKTMVFAKGLGSPSLRGLRAGRLT